MVIAEGNGYTSVSIGPYAGGPGAGAGGSGGCKRTP